MSTVTGGASKLLYDGSGLTKQAAAAAATGSVPRSEPEHGNVPATVQQFKLFQGELRERHPNVRIVD